MYFANYLLSIEDLVKASCPASGEESYVECDEALLQRAFSRVDEARRKKAERMGNAKSRAACLGAGLLLQLAVGEALCGTGGDLNEIRLCSVPGLLEVLAEMPPVSIKYRYSKNGKPYFAEIPFYFNLSHSGKFVLCGLSEEEIGADIQQHCACDRRRLADRFFSEQEKAALEACGGEETLFFRMWARKEAYGKLTGEGIANVLDMNMMTEKQMVLNGRGVEFEEIGSIAGYSIAFCRYSKMDDR